jgi:hypothetical protein
VRRALLLSLLLAGCAERRFEDIPARKMDGAFAEVATLKAYVLAGIHGFETSGGFDAQIVWRAPHDLRVQCSHFQFASLDGRFQLWIPDEQKMIHGTLEAFKRSEKGMMFWLFEACLPRKPKFFAFASRDRYHYGITDDGVVRYAGTTPIDRTDIVHVKYEDFHQGVPVQLIARKAEKSLHIAFDREKLKINVPVRDEVFRLQVPEGAVVEEFKP